MTKVIQIRDVPDRVHTALVRAAEDEGLSLTGYLRRELAWLADRPVIAQHNIDVIRHAREQIGARLDSDTIAAAVTEGRAER